MAEHSELTSFRSYDAISGVINKYIAAAKSGDPSALRDIFLPQADVRGTYGGKLTDWSLAEFCEIIERGGPAEGIESRIASIEISGNAAMARTEIMNWRGTRYTDFFVFVELGGAWKISSKAFYAHSRA